MIGKLVIAVGEPALLICDAKCNKAWGINNRPREQFDEHDPDDYAYLADHELGEAPEDPGTYEGDQPKPRRPEDRLNKWCFRECERSESTADLRVLVETDDFSKRIYNQPWKHQGER